MAISAGMGEALVLTGANTPEDVLACKEIDRPQICFGRTDKFIPVYVSRL